MDKLSLEDMLALKLVLSEARQAALQAQISALTYKNVLLTLHVKYKLVNGEQINENGEIIVSPAENA